MTQKSSGLSSAHSNDLLDRNIFDIADEVIKKAYPGDKKGWWGTEHIPNFGILRGAIAKAIFCEREKRSNHLSTE